MGWFFCSELIDNKCKYKTCWSKWVNCKVLLCTLLWVISQIGFPHSSFLDILSDNYDNHQAIAMSLWFTPQILTKFWKKMASNFDYRGSPTSTVFTNTISTSTNFKSYWYKISISGIFTWLLCSKISTSGNWLCSTH